MQADKIVAYLGFAIKKGSVIFGVDAAEAYRKKIFLIVYDETLSDNSRKSAEKIRKKHKCTSIRFKGMTLSEIVYRNNCKFVALTDKALGDAIEKSSGQSENYEIYPWEEKE